MPPARAITMTVLARASRSCQPEPEPECYLQQWANAGAILGTCNYHFTFYPGFPGRRPQPESSREIDLSRLVALSEF